MNTMKQVREKEKREKTYSTAITAVLRSLVRLLSSSLGSGSTSSTFLFPRSIALSKEITKRMWGGGAKAPGVAFYILREGAD
jgi:hypothetical protein